MDSPAAGNRSRTLRSVAASRLAPPALPKGFVSRAEILDRIGNHTLVVVVAPGGYGKTSLLTELARHTTATHWYTVRPDDAEPAHLAYGIGLSLSSGLPHGVWNEVHETLAAGTPESTAAALCELLEKLTPGWCLILDDLHLIGTESVSVQLLDTLLRDAPYGRGRIVLSGRTVTELGSLSRARAAGQMFEVNTTHLGFTQAEAAASLSANQLDPDEVSTLVDLCSGWPVLLRLAGSYIGALPKPNRAAALASLGGNHRALYDYITTELFAGTSAELRALLVKTSFCDSFTESLASHLVGAPAAASIKKAETAGWLQRTETEEGISYSYHPLLADFLWTRFSTETAAAEVKEHLVRAGEWMAIQQRWDEAFAYWKRANAPEKIVDQLYAWEVGSIEYWPIHGRWLNALTVEDLSSRPRLILRKALGYLLGCHVNEAFRWQELAEDLIAKSGDQEAAIDALANRAQLNFFAQNIDVSEQMYLALERKGDRLNDRQRMSAYAGIALVEMHRCEDLNRAQDYLEKIRKLATETQNWRSLCLAVGNLMTTCRLTGNYSRILQFIEEYSHEDGLSQPVLPRIYQTMGLIAYHADLGTQDAEVHLLEGLQRCGAANYNWLYGSLSVAAAVYYAERGRLEESNRVIDNSSRLPTTHKGVLICLDIARAVIAAKRGDRDEAARCLARTQPEFSSISSYEPTAVYTLLLIDRREAAAERASKAVHEARRRGMRFIEASSLFMLAAADGATAKDFRRLIELSKAHGYESMLLNRWPDLAPKVLTHALARNVEPEYVIKLLRQSGTHTLRVQTFGGLRVWLDDVDLDDQAWERPKSKALFAYLLVRDRKPAHSEEIAELFWPDQEVAAAKNSLRVAATRIRKAIERDEKRLIFENDHYHVDLGGASWQDRATFERLVEMGLQAEDPAEAADMLRQALEVFSGDFLPEYRYEEWAAGERERLETSKRRARLRLGKHLITLNRSGEAIRICEAATNSDPLDEAAVRLMLIALAETNRQDEARKVFLRLQTNLSKQLNSKPTAATLKLVQELGVV